MRISWGRRMGFMWGVMAGACMAATAFTGQWWMALFALFPIGGCILMGENDVAADGKSVAWGMHD